MAADLKTLIRLHEWKVDERRRILGKHLKTLQALENNLVKLEDELKSEQAAALASPTEGGMYYGAYADRVVERRAQINEFMRQTNEQIGAARSMLNKAYRELKKFEIADDVRQKKAVAEEARKEQIMLDDLGVQGFMSKKR